MTELKTWVRRLSSPSIIYYSLFWLMILLFWGTVAQKDLGLYQAQETFFSSWVLWLGDVVPTPGGRLTMLVITLNLTMKLFFASRLHWKGWGILITHFGAWLLMLGGLLTAYFSSEGNLVVVEGGRSNLVEDYHLNEIAFIDTRPVLENQVISFSGKYLRKGAELRHPELPFEVEVLDVMVNTTPVKKIGVVSEEERGMARRFDLAKLPRDPQSERNRGGVRLRISGLGDQDGVYALFSGMGVPQIFNVEGGEIEIGIRRRTSPLPFEVKLIDLERQVHPGTRMPKSFKSEVLILREGTKTQATISMNKPLRINEYTLFQSSFSEDGIRETSIFAVVENHGRIFPYISSIIICLGIGLHLVLQLPSLIRRVG